MQITDVRVRKVAKEGKLKAVVSITMDDEFVVHDIKVIEGEKGLFIAMPSKKALDGEYRDIAHPINSGTRDRIQTLILQKYEEAADEVRRGSRHYAKRQLTWFRRNKSIHWLTRNPDMGQAEILEAALQIIRDFDN